MNRFDPMDCKRIEGNLSAFVARELSADEAAVVASHIETCASCREALAAFVALEESLVARRDEVPSLDAFLPDFQAARARNRARPRLLLRTFRVVTSVPGVAVVLVMWASLLVARYNDRLTGGIADKTSLERVTAFAKQGLDAIVLAAGGDAWTLTAVYGALAIGLIVSAGALTMRLVRS
jgi:anti-sigma factor RsiW